MHEVGIAQDLIEQVERRLAEVKEPIKTLKISVLLGRLAGVSAEALQFGFEVAKRESKISFAQLEIVEIPLKLSCPYCQHSYHSAEIQITCPICSKGPLEVRAGKELRVDSLEYE